MPIPMAQLGVRNVADLHIQSINALSENSRHLLHIDSAGVQLTTPKPLQLNQLNACRVVILHISGLSGYPVIWRSHTFTGSVH